MNVSIGAKIASLAVALILATAATVGIAVFSGSNQLLVKQELEDLGDLTRLDAMRLNSAIESLRQDTLFLFRTPPIQGIIRAHAAGGLDPLGNIGVQEWHRHLVALFTELLRTNPDYLQARYIGIEEQGREIVRVERVGNTIVTIADKDLQRKGERPYFQETIQLQAGEVYLSDIDLNREYGRVVEPHTPVMRSAVPVYTPAGRVFGIVIINIAMAPLLDHLVAQHPPEHTVYVTNAQGDYLSHPDMAMRFGFDLGQRFLIQDHQPQLAPLFVPGSREQKMSLEPGAKENGMALYFRKVTFDPLRPGRFLGLAITASYRDVVAGSTVVRNRSITLTLLLVAVGTALAVFFSRILSRPLQQITRASKKVTAGEFDAPLPVTASGEIGTLANAFQKMIHEVRERDEALQYIVRGTAAHSGNNFFRLLARHLASALGVHCVMVVEVTDATRTKVRTLAVWTGEDYGENLEFDLAGTPCEKLAAAGEPCYYPEKVHALFPDDPMLSDLGAECFMGAPFFDSEDNFLGHIAVMDTKSLANAERARSIMNIFATRAGAEVERKAHIAKLEYMALYDDLTGLPNRSLLQEHMQQALVDAHRANQPLALLLLNLARLQEINDTLGHHNGDRVLQQTAQRLQAAVQHSTTIARLGSDEFAVLLPGVSTGYVKETIDSIQGAFEKPFLLEGTPIGIETHIGVAYYPEHGSDGPTLLRHADVAMHLAKGEQTGFRIYDADKDPSSLQRLTLYGELRNAIQNEELTIHYQPQIDIMNARIVSVEALVRWRHPEKGMIQPMDFIPLAEKCELIQPLTQWVLNEALRQCGIWQQAGLDIRVAINLSARNLMDASLPEHLASLLDTWGVTPDKLVLEITESATMYNPEYTLKILTRLNEMGISLSIDDFGTGYSSLSYLKRLPVDEIKIDSSFVMNMETDDNDAMIVYATIALAHNLGIRAIAEGVVNEETLELLKSNGCDIAQGSYISLPVPPDELSDWLDQSPWK